MLNVIRDALDAGGVAGYLRVYDGTRPATGGTPTSLLAELRFGYPSTPPASGGILTFNPITKDSSANADGIATWCRAVDGTGTFCFDGNVGLSDADYVLDTVDIETGMEVICSNGSTIVDGSG